MGTHRASVWLALGWFAAALLLLLADRAREVPLGALGGAYTYYVVVHHTWPIVLPAAFGLFGVLYLGPGSPIRLRPTLGGLHLAVMAAGAALMKAPQVALLAGGTPRRGEDLVEPFRVWNGVATLGLAVMGLSLLIFAWALVDGIGRRRPR